MSLLNDMLQDLSAHSKTKSVMRLRRFLPSVIIFVLVFCVVLLLRYWFAAWVPAAPPITAEVALQPADTNKVLDERLAALEVAIDSLSHAVADAQTPRSTPGLADSVNVAAPVDEPIADQPITDQASAAVPTTQSQASAASVSIREPFAEPVAEAPVAEAELFIAPNSAWQDQQTAAQARNLYQAGEVQDSIIQLQAFIASATHPAPESTRALLDIYIEQENVIAAESLLKQTGSLPATQQTYYRARLAVLQGDSETAIELLESQLVQAEQDEHYRALLAGLYQRSGLHEQAASHYRRLLSAFGEKPAYWLGFALAQDALNQAALAVQAYQRVNQYPDLQPGVRDYVQQRLQALQP